MSNKQLQTINPVSIKLCPNTDCNFSAVAELNRTIINGAVLDKKIDFSFNDVKTIQDFPVIFASIKGFIDFMAKARNIEFRISLMEKDKDNPIEFAKVKIYNKYKNICNIGNNAFGHNVVVVILNDIYFH